MSRHSFDPQIAAQVGLNAAVIYQNICFWIEKNEANGHNLRDGRYWTYNSVAAFAKLFPYLTAKQVRVAIEKLIEAGLIVKGSYGGEKYDRTAWYALNLPICPEGQMELPEMASGCALEGKPSAHEGKCNRNRYNPAEKPPPSCAEAQEVAEEGFQEFWDGYPKDRRRCPDECRVLFAEIVTEVSAKELTAAARSYAAESAAFTRSKVSFSDNWLRDQKWRRHVDDARQRGATESALNESAKQRVVETWVGWIRARNGLCRTLTSENLAELLKRGLVTHEDLSAAGLGR